MVVECPALPAEKRTLIERVSVEEQDTCYVVRDYGESAAKLLTKF